MKCRTRMLIAMVALVVLSGCVRVDIGDSKPTLGEQIMDLYQAKQAGVISEAEFKSLRLKLFKSL